MKTTTTERYNALSITLHWAMVLLLIAVYACIELREFFPKGSDPRNALKTWHFMLGLSVLALVLVRIVVNLLNTAPRIVPEPPILQTKLAKAMHLALYALMVCMPIAGWLILSAEGKAIPFFGFELPALLAKNKELAHAIEELHEAGGTIGYFLIGLHAVAGLYHHYVVKDNTLLRMLPGRR